MPSSSKASERPAIVMPTVQEDKAITAAARKDPSALPLTASQLRAMVPRNRKRTQKRG